ncbi:alpha/beta fold hydrolase [Actinoplanes xinjiangensis]|uniref:Pimeloyl-ACP methyl ester carboxylesterase n=1 Tax=Actinoplanes xinjiangensis TaxID=512350 RepID=A0A316FP80_9ACTN|nr:alpha/beta fold hydrolase [Actinoplanes xinjiangensis]PWK49480.1 pimeloyl-ACP methyl ester carboxylesterase [Actinoplanes xinjiangensis]GIF37485.1 hypothetical protein Axi01nite_17960 [Actinoplanes xinjiangensis]
MDAAGLDLHVRQRVATDRTTPCVLLHGLAVSHRYLMPTARHLDGRSVFVPDLPGFGLSGRLRTVVDVGGHAATIAALLDRLGTGPAALVGHSFGCQVAVELATRRPDLVTSLVLVGPTTDPAAATSAAQLRRLARDLLHDDWRQTPILAADIRDAGPRRILRTLRHAVTDRIDAKLPTIRVPVLLVRGGLDPITPAAWLERAASITPYARTLTIDGAAHNAATTAGPRLAAAIHAHLGAGHPA